MFEDDAFKSLVEAVEAGRTDILKLILDKVKEQVDREKYESILNRQISSSKIGSTLIHMAVQLNHVDAARALLREGCSLSADVDGNTAFDVIKSAEMKRAFVNELFQAVAASNIVDLPLLSIMDLNETFDSEESKNTTLHWAVNFADLKTIQYLIHEKKVSINCVNADGVTALHEAVGRNDPEIVRVLLEAGADPDIVATSGKMKDKSPRELSKSNEAIFKLITDGIVDLQQNSQENSSNTENSHLSKDRKDIINGSEIENNHDYVDNDKEGNHQNVVSVFHNDNIILEPDSRLDQLWPRPRKIRQLNGDPVRISRKIPLTITPSSSTSVHDILDLWDAHRQLMLERTERCVFLDEREPISAYNDKDSAVLHLTLNQNAFHIAGAYKIAVSHGTIKISCGSLEGLNYAIITLVQLMHLFLSENLEIIEMIPLVISDYPEHGIRGVLLDLNNYGRVPKMNVLLSMIDIWSYLKINHIHVFIRLSKINMWQLPFSKINLCSIDRYCKLRRIHFVPAIDVTSDISTLEDVKEVIPIYNQVLSCFDSSIFVHFGPRLTSLFSHSSTYLNLFRPSKEMTLMLCSNSLTKPHLPYNAIFLQYGFKKSLNNFDNVLREFQENGHDFAICTGTNAWSSLTGYPDRMMDNVLDASLFTRRYDGVGCVNAHWASNPSFSHLIFALPGYLASSGLTWNPDPPESKEKFETTLTEMLSLHVIGNYDIAKSVMDLGKAEESFLRKSSNDGSSILLQLLTDPDQVSLETVTLDDFNSVIKEVRRIQVKNICYNSGGSNHLSEEIGAEIQFNNNIVSWINEVHVSSELLLLGARIGRALAAAGTNNKSQLRSSFEVSVINCGIANLTPTFKTDIANKLLSLISFYRNVWKSRYITSGLEGSLFALTNLLKKLVPSSEE